MPPLESCPGQSEESTGRPRDFDWAFDLENAAVLRLGRDGVAALASSPPYEYVVAPETFSTDQIPHVARATKSALLVAVSGVDISGYKKALGAHFPFVLEIGSRDGGETMLACFHTHSGFWLFLLRCQGNRTPLSRLRRIDIRRSVIPALSQLKENPLPDARELMRIPSEVPFTAVFGGPEPHTPRDYTYWAEFYRGYLHMDQNGGELTESNPYLLLLRRLVQEGHLFDPGAMNQFRDEQILRNRVNARLQNLRDSEILPAVLFQNCAVANPGYRLIDDQGFEHLGNGLDGHHRAAAAYLRGDAFIDVYCFELEGTL